MNEGPIAVHFSSPVGKRNSTNGLELPQALLLCKRRSHYLELDTYFGIDKVEN